MPADRRALPLSAAIAPALAFTGLTFLARPNWPGITGGAGGTLILAAGFAAPLLVLCARAASGLERWLAVTLAALGGAALALHGGVAQLIAFDLDAGDAPHRTTLLAASGAFFGAFAVPAGLLAARSVRRLGTLTHVILGSAAGATGQLLWFGTLAIVEGTHGASLWLGSRVLIHAASGAVAGILAGSFLGSRPAGGAIAFWPVFPLPAAVPLAGLWLAAAAVSGALHVIALSHDDDRAFGPRLDAYFLALSNLYRAEEERLVYPGLHTELDRARRALVGAAGFDATLGGLTGRMLDTIERPEPGTSSLTAFRDAVRAVDRRLMDLGRDLFLEPHVIEQGVARPVRLVLRYRVTAARRYGLGGDGSVPVLDLRRTDGMPVDTPYTGLSHGEVATVLLDHVDLSALEVHAPLFAAGAIDPRPEDGRFSATRSLLRTDRHTALLSRLVARGHREDTLRRLGGTAVRFRAARDPSLLRSRLDAAALAAFDALADELAGQTAVHEARHALDDNWEDGLPDLDDLSAGALAPTAAAEIRAFIAEIVDGPLGPRFALAGVLEHVAGEEARANAYFFAGVVLLEGLWGEPVRRPTVAERDGPDGPRQVLLAIDRDSPGWLSYSRIHGAYSDLRALDPEDLRHLARELFERLFHEEYRPIHRLTGADWQPPGRRINWMSSG